jgi:hypothetical protein
MGVLVAIYELFDPREPGRVRYVGKTLQPAQRLTAHRRPKQLNRLPVARWSLKLRREGVMVQMRIIEWVEAWQEAERRWITHYRALGNDLLNIHPGGDSWRQQLAVSLEDLKEEGERIGLLLLLWRVRDWKEAQAVEIARLQRLKTMIARYRELTEPVTT